MGTDKVWIFQISLSQKTPLELMNHRLKPSKAKIKNFEKKTVLPKVKLEELNRP